MLENTQQSIKNKKLLSFVLKLSYRNKNKITNMKGALVSR